MSVRSEEQERKRTYKTKAETEAKKPVTSTIVLTLLFISGELAGRQGGGRHAAPGGSERLCPELAHRASFAAAHGSTVITDGCAAPPSHAGCLQWWCRCCSTGDTRARTSELPARLPRRLGPATSASRPHTCVPLPPLEKKNHPLLLL